MEELKSYVKEKLNLESVKLTALGSGESNYNYKINDDYVLRISRQDVTTENRLQNEHTILKFLETQGIDFVPKSVFFDKELNRHIVTFVGDKDISLNDLSREQLEIFVSQFIQIMNLDVSNLSSPETPLTSIEKYGIKRFEEVKKNCPDSDVIEWIKPRLSANVEAVKKLPRGKPGFIHGDLGCNMRAGDKLWFIDWEFARVSYYPVGSFAYAFVHSGCSESQFNSLLKIYCSQTGDSLEDLKNKLKLFERIILVNDVIWAAKRYSLMQKENLEGWEKYKELAYKRMAEFSKCE